MTVEAWQRMQLEAREAFAGAGRFPLPAYSEFMPAPFVGLKPYRPDLSARACTFGAEASGLDIDEYEQAHDLEPGLDRIGARIVGELTRLMRGHPHALSRTLLHDNPAWPADLAAAAQAGLLADEKVVIATALALSRTQDDKGNDRWTLFGGSHHGAGAALWNSGDPVQLAALVRFAGVRGSWRILADELPPALNHLRLVGPAQAHEALVTFTPFARLPEPIRRAYLARTLRLLPSPASLVWFEHPRYHALATQLPRANQIPLLHLFPRVEGSCAIRIPQSGWLDERDPAQHDHGHRVVGHLERTHRWQRVARDQHVAGSAGGANELPHGDGKYTDPVSVALFSSAPDELDLYGKPMARNAEVWTQDYALVLDGPRAGRAELARAAGLVDAGGRFGYRMSYPPMRAGARELFWHLPLVARLADGDRTERMRDGPSGYVSAEGGCGPELTLAPRLLARPGHLAAATQFERDAGLLRHTTSHNLRKLLEFRDLLGAPLSPGLARALVRTARHSTLMAWLEQLPERALDRAAGTRVALDLRACIGAEADPGAPLVLGSLGGRAFEEQIWQSISGLAEGVFRQKSNADGIACNKSRHGGPAARRAGLHVHDRRDLDALGDHLHQRYRALIEAHGLTGRAEVVDHRFAWETDFPYPWMGGWAANAQAPHERNVVCIIPGNNRGEAVIMGDHYDTAYMEDVYDLDAGGDRLRAPAQGADDNHSASTALLLAAEHLLPLARAGKLERDVWLVHLTGEEFPGDCLGARALCQHLVEGHLTFTADGGASRDVSGVRVVGAFVLDMIGHNSDRDRDVFQIAPGEGAGSARLALWAHQAAERWNRCCAQWNLGPDRHGLGRARRMPDGSRPPPPFAHLPLHGEVRAEWEPASALYNTDGQIFSDVGVPVVLFMENYDISRKGYHDTHDTMENIDLDYCAALTAIAIEAVAGAACAVSGAI